MTRTPRLAKDPRLPRDLLRILVVCVHITRQGAGVADGDFYPFGLEAGDKETPKSDDGGSPEIHLSSPFTYFGIVYHSLYVNNNGIVSFRVPVGQFTPEGFPLSDGRAFIAPYWADVHNALAGSVSYREALQGPLLARAAADIQRGYGSRSRQPLAWGFVATWSNVTFYGGSERTPINSFQLLLASNGNVSFVMFNYGDITWTTGTASGGDALTGLGGKHAQAGFNSGDEGRYFTLPGSRTSDIVHVQNTSNVNKPGRWIFRVDGLEVDPANGCNVNGQFHRYGEMFWTDEACSTKCSCLDSFDALAPDSVACVQEACGAHEACAPGPGAAAFSCRATFTAACAFFSGAHARTFDGALLRTGGRSDCSHALVRLCDEEQQDEAFSVEVVTQRGGRGRALSDITRLTVVASALRIALSAGNSAHVRVNGAVRSLPALLDNGTVHVYPSGFGTALDTSFGLKLSFVSNHLVFVSLPGRFFNKTCGMCGNFNNDTADDFPRAELNLTAESERRCAAPCTGNCCDCSSESHKRLPKQQTCGTLNRTSGPFVDCHAAVEPGPFVTSCLLDACLAAGGNGSRGGQQQEEEQQRRAVCRVLEAYALLCQALGASLQPWRVHTPCGSACQERGVYALCGSACSDSCGDRTAAARCAGPCRESCRCPRGSVLAEGRCADALEACGCVHRGLYFPVGQVGCALRGGGGDSRTRPGLPQDGECSRRCTCGSGGEVRCQELQRCAREDACHADAASACTLRPDWTIATFDDALLRLPKYSGFVLTRLCDYSTRPDQNMDFQIVISGRNQPSDQQNTISVDVNILHYSLNITRSRSGILVQMDGSPVLLPLSLGGGSFQLYEMESGMTVSATNVKLQITFSVSGNVVVCAGERLQGLTCGLCGNFNGNASDDAYTPDGVVADNLEEFVFSWRRGIITCTDFCKEFNASCLLGDQHGEQACLVLLGTSHNPFAACHSTVDPRPFHQRCLRAACLSPRPQAGVCRAIEAYEVACGGIGVRAESWRNATFCHDKPHLDQINASSPLSATRMPESTVGEETTSAAEVERPPEPTNFIITDSLLVEVSCFASHMEVVLPRLALSWHGYSVKEVHLNDERCTPRTSPRAFRWQLVASYGACGNTMRSNTTHVAYVNTIRMRTAKHVEDAVVRETLVNVEFACAYERDIRVSLNTIIQPMTSVINMTLPVKKGTFVARMLLYVNASYRFPHDAGDLLLSTLDTLFVGVVLKDEGLQIFPDNGRTKAHLVLVLNECWATPGPNPADDTRYTIIHHGCTNPRDSTAQVEENAVSQKCRFHVKVFRFVGNQTEIHLHCDVSLCDAMEAACTVKCPTSRTLPRWHSDVPTVPEQVLSIGPIRRRGASSPGERRGPDTTLLWSLSLLALCCLPRD
ncbi:alpha-tectorin-like [Lethenteron reissneri]|uniref:alpha-tectorin-like n=1 Tax=Lethenteron reissneri TaxID=7753 RepID=UPI002AB7AAD9|nr:alpha-tectorin-like [Lethenteron reissneri]